MALVVTQITRPEVISTTLSTRLEMMAIDPESTAAVNLAASKILEKHIKMYFNINTVKYINVFMRQTVLIMNFT